jgi:hypothetical protein
MVMITTGGLAWDGNEIFAQDIKSNRKALFLHIRSSPSSELWGQPWGQAACVGGKYRDRSGHWRGRGFINKRAASPWTATNML